MRYALLLAVAGAALLVSCKPPPTDEAAARGALAEAPDAPSEPIDSPDTTAAFWAPSSTPGRLLYGNPGERPLLALGCLEGSGNTPGSIRFTRMAPADEGAGAFMAIVGNFHIIRMPVDAVEVGQSFVWQGEIAADDPDLEALTGRRPFTLTIPGAGMLTIEPDDQPRNLIAQCRGQFDEDGDAADNGAEEPSGAPDLPASAE